MNNIYIYNVIMHTCIQIDYKCYVLQMRIILGIYRSNSKERKYRKKLTCSLFLEFKYEIRKYITM